MQKRSHLKLIKIVAQTLLRKEKEVNKIHYASNKARLPLAQSSLILEKAEIGRPCQSQ